MLCELCSSMPYKIFIPSSTGKSCQSRDKWEGVFWHHSGADALEKLRKSAEAGCGMCMVLCTAFETAPLYRELGYLDERQPGTKTLPPKKGILVCVVAANRLTLRCGKAITWLAWESKRYKEARYQVHDIANCSENFHLARNWLEICLEGHQSCQQNHRPHFLPTRLIGISDSGRGKIDARLICTADHNDTISTRYIALSHCWGSQRGKKVPKTTKSNLKDHLQRIEPLSLSKTYQEALTVAFELGIRYIWIDSLCIIQDDKEDFERECCQMNKVYAQATCTISASDSYDGDGGCFIPRDSNRLRTCILHTVKQETEQPSKNIENDLFGTSENHLDDNKITILPYFGPWSFAIRGPVSTRGWCLQERELSPRILHFTKDRLLWECRTDIASEDQPRMTSKYEQIDRCHREASPGNRITPQIRGIEPAPRPVAHIHPLAGRRMLDDDDEFVYLPLKFGDEAKLKWYGFVEEYTERSLSVKSDKLPAISGIAAEHARYRPGDTYLAGIWAANLLSGLTWFPKRTTPPTAMKACDWPPSAVDQGIPSWSWAAYDGAVKFHGESWFKGSWVSHIDRGSNQTWTKRELDIAIESYHVVTSSHDKYGRVKRAEIVLSGWVAELALPDHISTSLPTETCARGRLHSKCYSFRGLAFYFDYDVEDIPDAKFLCVRLGLGMNARGTMSKVYNGLLLMQPEVERPEIYKRVGIFDVAKDDLVWSNMWHQKRFSIV